MELEEHGVWIDETEKGEIETIPLTFVMKRGILDQTGTKLTGLALSAGGRGLTSPATDPDQIDDGGEHHHHQGVVRQQGLDYKEEGTHNVNLLNI